jgi:hypothetical protein
MTKLGPGMGVYARANQAEFDKDVLWLHDA